MAVFDEGGQKVGESVFTADADGPSRPRLPRRIRRPEDDRGRPIIVALPGTAAPDVAEKTIPGVADTTGHGRQRADPAVIGNAGLERAVVAVLGVRRGVVALDGDHQAAGKLIIASGLSPADPAVHIMSAERPPEENVAGRPDDPFRRLGPQAAGLNA